MNLSIIAAIGKNGELGKNNDLIWKLKEDMKFFKTTTIGHTVVMGRNTYESLPKILPNRKNIVLSTHDINNKEVEVYKNIKDFLTKYKDFSDEIFIIGGASVYSAFIDMVNKMYLTEIDATCTSADVYFPKFNLDSWIKEEISSIEENSIKYKHVLYKKKK